MSYVATRGSRQIYRCLQCGCEIMVVARNSHAQLAGRYISDESLKLMDKEYKEQLARNNRRIIS